MFPQVRYRCLPILKVGALLLLAFGAASRLRALDAAAMQAMVIVEGEEGRGSGFIVKMDGKTFLVTNSHVVRGNKNVKFKNLRNAEITTGPLQIADEVDAVRAPVVGATNALELETQIEKVNIGDEVIVAGNSEGEGVVREIPGKVVGIGPDRIEVDAEFVPGNSGSPILLKSTGKVIGVATYMKIPRGGRAGSKSPFSLNEVRRFGFRLDTVARWVTPATKDRLMLEGIKLAEMEKLMSSISAVFGANAAFVTKWGASNFVTKEQAQQFPAFAALSLAIEDFAKQQTAAKGDAEKAKNVTALFTRLRALVADDVRGLKENQFSGYYAVQLKESLARFQDFFDWCDGTAMPAYREMWLTSQGDPRFAIVTQPSAPAVDPKKLSLVLTDRLDPNEPPDYCHRVGYPSKDEPSNLENLFWIIEDPQKQQRAISMHKTNVRVRTTIAGTYHVSVEYRSANLTRTVSNVVEFKYAEPVAKLAGKPAVATTTAADRSKPLAEFLAGTKWLWYGRPNEVLEFHKDGKVYYADWARQNLVTGWEATGQNQVTLTILSGRNNNRTATLAFSEDRVSFTGHDFDPSHAIAKSPRVPPPDRQDSASAATGQTWLLAKENEARWQPLTGEWKIRDGVLTGSGDCRTTYPVAIAPPFTLEYKIKVLEGMRPRVRIGPLTCGNEGFATTLALYPPGSSGGTFSYRLKEQYKVSINVTREKVELSVDGELISTGAGMDQEIKTLEFSGGDSWSKGVTEYREIALIK